MKTYLSAVLTLGAVGILAGGLSGCDDHLSEMKDSFQKATGITVNLLAPDTDSCATQQVQAFLKEFKSLDSDEAAALRTRLARFSAIEVRPTVASKTITGAKIDLVLGREQSYVENVCYPKPGSHAANCSSPFPEESKGCTCQDVASTRFVESARKQIANSIEISGSDPVTQITRADQLVIQTQKVQNEVREGAYRTTSAAVYEDVQKFEDEAFKQAERYQALEGGAYTYHAPDCGKLASIRDLAAAL